MIRESTYSLGYEEIPPHIWTHLEVSQSILGDPTRVRVSPEIGRLKSKQFSLKLFLVCRWLSIRFFVGCEGVQGGKERGGGGGAWVTSIPG